MRKSNSMPGWRSLASRYCCIMGVDMRVRWENDSSVWRSGFPGYCACATPSKKNALLAVLARPNFAHCEAIAGRMVSYLGHVMAHEEEAAAVGTLEVFRRQGIGHLSGVEAGPFINDADVDALARNVNLDADLLAAVEAVAML